MTARQWIVGCAIVLLAPGCYRTVYRQLEPPGETARPRAVLQRSSTWRSFFLYGWLPSQLVVRAAAECGDAGNVREIRTRRSFGQGLVAKFASSGGVNVYSPWTGEVVCGDPPLAADPVRTPHGLAAGQLEAVTGGRIRATCARHGATGSSASDEQARRAQRMPAALKGERDCIELQHDRVRASGE